MKLAVVAPMIKITIPVTYQNRPDEKVAGRLSASPDRDAINCLSVAPERIDTESGKDYQRYLREVFRKFSPTGIQGNCFALSRRLLMPILKIVAPGGRVIAVAKLATQGIPYDN